MRALLKLRKEKLNESGFTLIEILVVILIIGILVVIAIPLFLNQRQVSNDATTASDAKNAVSAIEDYLSSNPSAVALDATYIRNNVKKSPGSYVSIYGDANHYCVTGAHANGKKYKLGMSFAENGGKRPYYMYSSLDGGTVQNEGLGISGLPSCNHSPIHI